MIIKNICIPYSRNNTSNYKRNTNLFNIILVKVS